MQGMQDFTFSLICESGSPVDDSCCRGISENCSASYNQDMEGEEVRSPTWVTQYDSCCWYIPNPLGLCSGISAFCRNACTCTAAAAHQRRLRGSMDPALLSQLCAVSNSGMRSPITSASPCATIWDNTAMRWPVHVLSDPTPICVRLCITCHTLPRARNRGCSAGPLPMLLHERQPTLAAASTLR